MTNTLNSVTEKSSIWPYHFPLTPSSNPPPSPANSEFAASRGIQVQVVMAISFIIFHNIPIKEESAYLVIGNCSKKN
jgi:hypothetical protein